MDRTINVATLASCIAVFSGLVQLFAAAIGAR